MSPRIHVADPLRAQGTRRFARPYPLTKPEWATTTQEELVAQAVQLSKTGLSAAQVGLNLRDAYGVPSARAVTGKRLGVLLRESGISPEIPDDLQALLKRIVHMQRHLETHPKDLSNQRGLSLMESRNPPARPLLPATQADPRNVAVHGRRGSTPGGVMPSGPDGFVSDPHYSAEFERARALLLAHPRRWRISIATDGNGIAARIMPPSGRSSVSAIRRKRPRSLGSSATASRPFSAARAGPVLVVDTGASWLDLFAEHRAPVVVLDHHKYPGVPNPPPLPEHVAFVNPLDWGVDGMNELCAATLTWLYTVFLDPLNWDNAAWGLSGAIADRQHVGGFRGLNGVLVQEALRRSLVVRRPGSPSSARASARRCRAASTRSCGISPDARPPCPSSSTGSGSNPAPGRPSKLTEGSNPGRDGAGGGTSPTLLAGPRVRGRTGRCCSRPPGRAPDRTTRRPGRALGPSGGRPPRPTGHSDL